jgi:hypothetical protein
LLEAKRRNLPPLLKTAIHIETDVPQDPLAPPP